MQLKALVPNFLYLKNKLKRSEVEITQTVKIILLLIIFLFSIWILYKLFFPADTFGKTLLKSKENIEKIVSILKP